MCAAIQKVTGGSILPGSDIYNKIAEEFLEGFSIM
jgi:hypothetical protein